MGAEWTRYCQARDLTLEDKDVVIACDDGRRHRVTVEVSADAYLMRAVVIRQTLVASIPELPIQVWTRNRAATLVGFRIDQRGRLIGEAWLPKAGISAEEFQLYLRTLAVESDRFEYALTGRDSE